MEELSSEAMFGSDFGAERMWGLKELILASEGFSPQTIAWLCLAALVISVLLIALWRRYRYWQSQAYRRDTLLALVAMQSDFSKLNILPKLLRQVALQSAPRKEVIAASGADWISWLNHKAGKTLFNEEDADLLKNLAYANLTCTDATINKGDSEHLIKVTAEWIRGNYA